MQTGAITGYIDVAQVVLYAFWVFFAGLILYLRREDKREGYPLESDRSGRVLVQGFPAMPRPKTYLLRGGHTVTLPNVKNDRRDVPVVPIAPWPGVPMEPTGNPMIDGVGAASYADREDVPELALDGGPSIVPLRVAPGTTIEPNDPDPRGMSVIGADNVVAGTVRDVWVDRAEALIRYLEVEVPEAGRTVLLPMAMARVNGRRGYIAVNSLLARHFADVPAIASPDQVTKREEDRIVGYYGGGQLYATPSRLGPLL